MNLRWWGMRLTAAVLVVAGISYLLWQMNDTQQVLRLHGYTYRATILRTPDELVRGLSGTNILPKDHAAVFVFPRNDRWAIWMKDMQYPIDIVWLNSNKQVIHMVKEIQPSSYPKFQPQPDTPARYVIELPSGTIERTGIALGDPAGLPSGV